MESPGSTSSLRAANQRRVVTALRARQQLSQAEIARTTQLAPATISNIVRELSTAGFLEFERGSGRRGATVRIARSAGLVAGVDFGHSHVQVALGDLSGTPIGSLSKPLANDSPSDLGLKLANELLDELLETNSDTRESLHAIGMGLPAPIAATGVIESESILPGWVGINATEVATKSFGAPTLVDNDANLGAIAESVAGAGIGHTCMAFLKISSGVGCGLILDGKVFHGGTGTAGEIGHLTMNENGPLCRCGSRGCLEAYAGADALVAQFSARQPGTTAAGLFALAAAGDIGAQRLVEDAGRYLGQASSILANLLGPTLIVVGGEMAAAGTILLDGLRDGLRRHSLDTVARKVEVCNATAGDRSSVIGGLLLALDAVELPH